MPSDENPRLPDDVEARSETEKKIPIKPRAVKAADEDGDAEKKSANKLASKVQPSGVPFEARAQSRPIASEWDPEPREEPAAEGRDTALPAPAKDIAVLAEAEALTRRIGKHFRQGLMVFLRRRVRVGVALGITLVLVVLAVWIASGFARHSERARMLAEISRQGVGITQEKQDRLDKALRDLREGDSEKALNQLVLLEHEAPEVASLAYLVALAAMQAGQPELSAQYVEKSIARRERVSDAIALKAVLETQGGGSGVPLGDPRLRAEGYLRQAMLADAANASPLVELATLLRYRKQNDEAMRVLEAARSRLNPVDSHTVVDVSIALLALQETPDAQLPLDIDPDKDVPSLFSAAYLAMRRGNFPEAAGILKTARERLSPDLFFYLVNDPAFRKYAREKDLAGCFE